jgi:hypothetical protein
VNRLLSLTPPLSDNSKSCRADRHSDPTPNDTLAGERGNESPTPNFGFPTARLD